MLANNSTVHTKTFFFCNLNLSTIAIKINVNQLNVMVLHSIIHDVYNSAFFLFNYFCTIHSQFTINI